MEARTGVADPDCEECWGAGEVMVETDFDAWAWFACECTREEPAKEE